MFQDYGKFSSLMSSTKRGSRDSIGIRGCRRTRDARTPSLVSFVGQTGAGKSTLIRLLIDLASTETNPTARGRGATNFPTPVVGASGSHVPTSENVHLYLDPSTAQSTSPILFADCEGLNGGERDPAGARMKKRRRRQKETNPHDTQNCHDRRVAKLIHAVSEQELTWADSPFTRTREFAVINLYPRFLYTFSDVIVFVLMSER
jgi:energy-coupling factor transporter ATP-binding protein EcfA2